MVGFFAVRGYRAVVVRRGVLPVLLFTTASLVRGQQPSSLDQLVQQFESDTWFSRQFQVAKAIVAENDRSVLPRFGALVDAQRPVLSIHLYDTVRATLEHAYGEK